MKQSDNYLSEFEQAFELDGFGTDAHETDEFAGEYELENDFEDEAGEEMEHDTETGEEQGNGDHEDMLYEYQPGVQDYEERLYNALNSEYESSYEMEQEIDGILHEMEIEYFWKPLKNVWKKYKGTITNAVKKFVPGNVLPALSSLAGGDLRGLLKSNLLKKGLSLAANAVAPGVGGALAGAVLNREAESYGNLRNQVSKYTNIGRNDYKNLAGSMPMLRRGNVPAQLNALSKRAFQTALGNNTAGVPGRRQEIPLAAGASVTVHPNRVVIHYP